MAVITTILAVIKAIPIVETWFQALVTAYIQAQTMATLSAIADAAALAARATTDDERYQAAIAWRQALSRNRVS